MKIMKRLVLWALTCATAVSIAQPISTQAADSTAVTEELLDRIAMIESSGGKFLVGDNGKSLGVYQMGRLAWKDATEYRKQNGLPVWAYQEGVMHPDRSRSYAKCYLKVLEYRLHRLMGRQPTPAHIYSAYNWGLSNLRKVDFDLQRIPNSTKRAIAKLS
jgi:hypothetical protein